MNKRLLFVLLLWINLSAVMATNLTGTVRTSDGEAIAYATIAVLDADSALVNGATTDDAGAYSMSLGAGTYIVRASFIGYHTQERTYRVQGNAAKLDFVLEEGVKQLQEVEVKGKKPLIERQMDKLVLNVSASPLTAGSNGQEVLRRAPGVNIDKDGNVTVNGKGVEVYIDGRPSYLSGEQLRAMLQGTDGNTIEKIEIITNPSAKYDAAGAGGIINIKTKKNMMQGLNGTLSASYGGMYFKSLKCYNQQDFLSLNLNYRTDKTYTNVSLTQMYADMCVGVDNTSETPVQKRVSKSDYNLDFQYYQLKVANDWMIDKRNTLGFILQVPFMTMKQGTTPTAYNGYVLGGVGKQDTIETSLSTTSMNMRAPQHTANLNYTHVFSDSLERELTANLDYNRYSTNTRNAQDNRYLFADRDSLWNGLNINTNQTVDIYSAKLDFQTHFWGTGMLEAGAKYGLSNTFNNMRTDSLLNGANDDNRGYDQRFNYSEHVGALYLTLGKTFGQHFSVKLGLRGEYTHSRGNWVTADSTTTKNYFNLFPTAFLGYTSSPLGKLAQPISTSISYTRRIKRPSYYQLNPFRTYIDAHSYQEGNTELMPEFNNDVEVNFSYSQYLALTFNFSHTQDMQQQKTEILPNGDGVMHWINFGTCTTHGGNLSLTELPIVPKLKDGHLEGAWLALTLNAGYFCFINRSYKAYGDYYDKNHFYRMSGNLNAYLPKNWTLSLDGWYSAPMTIGYNRQDQMYGFTAGIRKMIMEKGLILNLKLEDALRSLQYNQYSQGLAEGYSTGFRQRIYNQKLSFSLTWMFGTQQWHKQRNVGTLDEAGRLGGGTGSVGQ